MVLTKFSIRKPKFISIAIFVPVMRIMLLWTSIYCTFCSRSLPLFISSTFYNAEALILCFKNHHHHHFVPSHQQKIGCNKSAICPITCLRTALGQTGSCSSLDDVHPSVSLLSSCCLSFDLAHKCSAQYNISPLDVSRVSQLSCFYDAQDLSFRFHLI